jgi:hypothetical protein
VQLFYFQNIYVNNNCTKLKLQKKYEVKYYTKKRNNKKYTF